MGGRQTFYITYNPSGTTYQFIPPLYNNDAYAIDPSPNTQGEIYQTVLESHGYDITYPGQWCDALIQGAVTIEMNQVLFQRNNAFLGLGYEISKSRNINLNLPLSEAYPRATSFVGGEEFGQDAQSTYPSRLEIKYSGNNTNIEWYYNNVLLKTDTIAGHHVDEFKIAVKNDRNALIGYSYVWAEGGTYWTSGDVSDPDVLQYILRNQGDEGGGINTVEGWYDPDNPDKQFIISTLYWKPGYYNWVAGGRSNPADTPTTATDDLYDLTSNYPDGLVGTDVVQYIANKDGSAQAWDFLKNDPESDGVQMSLPSSDPEQYNYYIKWNFTDQRFELYNGETWVSNFGGVYRENNALVLISTMPDNRQRLGVCYLLNVGGSAQYNLYNYLPKDAVDTEEFDLNEALLQEYNGYSDPDQDPGEEDDPQKDADEMEDPSVDPLATGFVYAFNVDEYDMTHLVESLNHDTLAGKIKDDFGNHLFDFIVSYHTMPCVNNADHNSKVAIEYRGVPFVYGESDTPLTLAQITKSWYKVDLGTKKCLPQKVRGDGFENWSQAQVQIYLPFIGTHHLNTADVWGKDVHVVYYFDVLAGTCVANIGVEGKGVLYTYESSCSYKIPFTSTIDQSMQNIMSGVMSAGSSIMGTVTSAMTGNVPGAISSAMSGANAVGSFISASEHKALISRGGQLGGTGGWHTPRSPALIITIPDVANVSNSDYMTINGYPTHKSSNLSSYKGSYVEVGNIDLKANANSNGAFPNDSEMEMIRSALKDGVYV